jgi:hypothetical protein
MKISREIIERIDNGDHINDSELQEAIEFYSELQEGLSCLGYEYRLARKPVRDTLLRLERFQHAREENKQ